MAVMIPDIDPMTIANNGERLFYEASAALPGDYTGHEYSLKNYL